MILRNIRGRWGRYLEEREFKVMKTVLISNGDYEKLKLLAKNYYVVRGEKPMPLKEVLHQMIQQEYNDYSPREYISPLGRGD